MEEEHLKWCPSALLVSQNQLSNFFKMEMLCSYLFYLFRSKKKCFEREQINILSFLKVLMSIALLRRSEEPSSESAVTSFLEFYISR